jgi:AAHS family 4-hydroxybenzoate transporter-like MFS transporter
LAFSWWIERNGFSKVLIPTYLVAAFATIMIGQVQASLPWVFLTIFVAGFRVVGSQPEINALPSAYYPTSPL